MDSRARSDRRPDAAGDGWRSSRARAWVHLRALVLASALASGGCKLDELVDASVPPDAGGSPAPPSETVARLDFAVQPTSAPAGSTIAPPVTVAAVDSEGRAVTDFNGTITIVVDENPGGAILTGGTARPAVNGVAVFDDLALTHPGDGYRLAALTDGVAATVSATFDVLLPIGLPARMSREDGFRQSGTVGARLDAPYVVRVADGRDIPVPGVSVRWDPEAGSGTVSPPVSVTNAEGLASTFHSLGTEAGEQRVRAAVTRDPGVSVTFTSTAVHDAAHSIAFTVQPSDVEEDRDIRPPVEVTVYDQYGNPTTRLRELVTMSLVPFTGNFLATLRGDLREPLEDGVARFGDLRITRSGSGFRLRARFGDLQIESQPFSVVER